MSIQFVLDTAARVTNNRTMPDIFRAMNGEMNELADEVQLALDDDVPGPDGILGEAVDVMSCLLDLIYKSYPNITQAEIEAVMVKKAAKWERLYSNTVY
jgi:hypothetical protein